jgi:hypothetical protein
MATLLPHQQLQRLPLLPLVQQVLLVLLMQQTKLRQFL